MFTNTLSLTTTRLCHTLLYITASNLEPRHTASTVRALLYCTSKLVVTHSTPPLKSRQPLSIVTFYGELVMH
ncbi:hypothetical protein VNO78_23937 [Psophocarpus tetragonolobus]|uniref:Uncharacterized protein n=1 Tax=Psophocarpus tetragonolobus TaxID=3891 RepID=A0AAN9S5D3_PSOTE